MQTVEIFTDGACCGNPGPGGWAALLRYKQHEVRLSGAEEMTTNNRMELTAAIQGLKALTRPCIVVVVTDSEYVKKGISEWLAAWEKKGWRTANNKPVKNQDLWQALLAEAKRHQIEWKWVRGHSGHLENEEVDMLAKNAITELMLKKGKE